MAANERCTLSVAGYGIRQYRCVALDHGLDVNSNEGQGRNRKAFYAQRMSESNFSIALVFTSYKQKEEFTRWMQSFIRQSASTPLAITNPMKVMVPARKFIKHGFPTSAIPYGDSVGTFFWVIEVNFEGVSAKDYKPPAISQFSMITDFTKVDQTTKYFYPAGEQLSGTQSAEDSIYATPDEEQLAGNTTRRTGHSGYGFFK